MSNPRSLFILGLLMLNIGCPTGSPVRRHQFSVKADGSVEAEPPSLIEVLANMLPEDATHPTQSLLMLAKEGAPKDEMLKFVSDLKSEIEPWHADATATLKKSIDAVHECATTMEGAVANDQEKKSKCDVEKNSHKLCRTEESTKFKNKVHWEAEQAEKKEIMDTECKIFSDVEEEVRAAKASYGGGDVESFLVSVCDDFSALQPRYEDAKEKCTTAKAEYARVSAIYVTAVAEYTAQKTACDKKQTDTEVTCCQYAIATKDTCDSYGTCYEDKVAEYTSVKKVVESEEKLKKVEWRIWSRIECLLPVLGTDNAAKIEECRAKEHSTAHLDIDYPAIPAKDSCTIDTAYPGTDAYYNAHMASLPDDAKGAAVAECVGLAAQITPSQALCSGFGVNWGDRFIQLGKWRLGAVDDGHISMAHQDGKTAQIYRSDGTLHPGPRTDWSTWSRPVADTPSEIYFGDRFIQLGKWRLGAVDDGHASIAHQDGKTAQIFRSDGTLHPGPRTDWSTWSRTVGTQSGIDFGDRFIQFGKFRLGAVDDGHASIAHQGGKTEQIFRSDGTLHPGPRTDWTTWARSTENCKFGEASKATSGYRYWKLEMRQNDNPVCQVFQEIEFICGGVKRTGVTAMEASGEYLEYHAQKAVDGNEQTYWAQCFGGQGAVDWITFDLGTTCSLTDVKTKSRAHQSMQMQPDVMLLQASATGEDGSWHDIHEWNNGNDPEWQEIKIPEGAA